MSKQFKAILIALGLLPGFLLVLFVMASDISRTATTMDTIATVEEMRKEEQEAKRLLEAGYVDEALDQADALVGRQQELYRRHGLDGMAEELEAEREGMRLARSPRPVVQTGTKRVQGAYYPEDHVQEEPGPPLLALAVAGAGGLVVFLGVGAAAFLLLRPREEEPAVLPEEEDDGDLVQFD